MQSVKFRNIDDFLEFLPQEELEIVEFLREIVYECVPDVKEKLSYNVPYFKRFYNICFIWPASVFWGSKKTYEGVRFGFTKGYLMQDEHDYLDKTNRKQVYMRDFKSIEEIDVQVLKSYLFEAVVIDEELFKAKK